MSSDVLVAGREGHPVLRGAANYRCGDAGVPGS